MKNNDLGDYRQYKCSCGSLPAYLNPRNDGISRPRVHPITKRPWCSKCKSDYEAQKAGYKNDTDKRNKQAIEDGYLSYTHKKTISSNDYRSAKFFQPVCSNIDGNLGVSCLTVRSIQTFAKKALDSKGKIKPKYRDDVRIPTLKAYMDSLSVDHIDGQPWNNSIENLQTLCPSCHSFKSKKNGDHLSEGRSSDKYKNSSKKIKG